MALNQSEVKLSEEELKQLEIVKTNHDEAYLYLSQGISYQERHQYSLARDMYTKGLEKINKALSVRCDRPYCKGPQWMNAFKLQQKMIKTSRMAKSQLQDIENLIAAAEASNGVSNGNSASSASLFELNSNGVAGSGLSNEVMYPQWNDPAPDSPPEALDQPPSYDEACSFELDSDPRRASYPLVTTGSSKNKSRLSTEVVELFSVQDEVIIFFVAKDGTVSTSSSQSSLHVYQFVDFSADLGTCPPAWLQVGSWTYPLVPGQSPALESGYGAFLFPNIGEGEGSAVGIILPPSVDTSKRAIFLQILNSFSALVDENASSEANQIPRSESFSDVLSRGLVTGAEYLSAGIVKGASISSDLIHKGAAKARQKISPDDQSVAVDPRVKDGLKIAREASGIALKATGFLVRKLGELTLSLGKQLAPHIKEQSSRLLCSALNTDKKEANDKIDGVLTVAAGGLQGFSTIYMGLEQAAKTLAYSLSTETVNIVGHKYGNEVGEVVNHALFSIGNLALTTHNVQSLGVKAIAKKTAKDAGKAVLQDYIEPEKESLKPEKQ